MRENIIENVQKYKVGIYIRLSKEDYEKPQGSESESVQNQRNLLIQYIKQNHLYIVDEYVDDGVSGTSFDRPEFNRMIQDIENKKINMIITKDLSRLGRDYIMSGYYTEQYFPLHNVRYIALLDNIDTYLDSSNNDIAPFKSILNDMYAKDISKKIKSVLKSKKEMGLFVGKEAPYGYQKDPNNKYQLIIDESAAMIVREIFERYLNGDGTKIIADDLSQRHVPIPSVHKKTNIGYKSPSYGLWNNTAIKRILQNEEYTGCLVQNKYNKLNYKSKKLVHLPEEKWVKTENTHEAIVDKKMWERAQILLERSKGTRIRNYDYLLSGLLKCYECKSAIGVSHKTGRSYSYGRCQRYTKYSKLGVCTPHSFNYFKLEEQIINMLRDFCNIYSDKSRLQLVASKSERKDREAELKEKIEYYTNLEEKENTKLERLYDDMLDNLISREDYKRMSDKVVKNRETIVQTKKSYEEQYEEYKSKTKSEDNKKLEKLIDEFLAMENPTKEIIGQFIEKIEIHQDKQVDIHFRFQPFSEMMESQNKDERRYA
ncbi:MAG: recombinase family protein [Clostridia bacterium]|nr:recombinase family protein [Clostridia bacterium]